MRCRLYLSPTQVRNPIIRDWLLTATTGSATDSASIVGLGFTGGKAGSSSGTGVGDAHGPAAAAAAAATAGTIMARRLAVRACGVPDAETVAELKRRETARDAAAPRGGGGARRASSNAMSGTSSDGGAKDEEEQLEDLPCQVLPLELEPVIALLRCYFDSDTFHRTLSMVLPSSLCWPGVRAPRRRPVCYPLRSLRPAVPHLLPRAPAAIRAAWGVVLPRLPTPGPRRKTSSSGSSEASRADDNAGASVEGSVALRRRGK